MKREKNAFEKKEASERIFYPFYRFLNNVTLSLLFICLCCCLLLISVSARAHSFPRVPEFVFCFDLLLSSCFDAAVVC